MIVLYDADCGFCEWAMAWALGRDANGALSVAPIQSPTGDRLLADMSSAERLRSVHVVGNDGRRRSGGSAAREVLRALPSARPLARLADLWPRATDLVYDFVADHRGWFGRLVSERAKRRAEGVLARAGAG